MTRSEGFDEKRYTDFPAVTKRLLRRSEIPQVSSEIWPTSCCDCSLLMLLKEAEYHFSEYFDVPRYVFGSPSGILHIEAVI